MQNKPQSQSFNEFQNSQPENWLNFNAVLLILIIVFNAVMYKYFFIWKY